jgi:hypothetical protein
MELYGLPKPVLNFLRTMSEDKARYSMHWDIHGTADGMVLKLIWELDATDHACTAIPIIVYDSGNKQANAMISSTQPSDNSEQNFKKESLRKLSLIESTTTSPINLKTPVYDNLNYSVCTKSNVGFCNQCPPSSANKQRLKPSKSQLDHGQASHLSQELNLSGSSDNDPWVRRSNDV